MESSTILAPQWINKRAGSGLSTGAGNKPGESDQRRDTNRTQQPGQQQLRPVGSACWGSSKPAPSRGAPATSDTRNPFQSQAANRGVRAQLQDLLPSTDLRSNRVIEAFRSSSVTSIGANGTHKATFDVEFPSLRDTAASQTPAPSEPQQTEPSPAPNKQAPYRPSYLVDRLNTNWTSKLADAPSLPPQPDPLSPARETSPSPAPPVPSTTTTPAPHPEPFPPSQPTAVTSGWVSHANGNHGEGGRTKLLDTLSGAASGTTQQAATQDADAFRAQLAVRQSKQLIPVLARKDKPGEGPSTSNAAAKLAPAPNLPGRNTLMGTVTMLRQASTGAERAHAAAVNANPALSADGKLQLRPLLRRATTATPSTLDVDSTTPVQKSGGGMLALRKSPPSRKSGDALVVAAVTGDLDTTCAQINTRRSEGGTAAATAPTSNATAAPNTLPAIGSALDHVQSPRSPPPPIQSISVVAPAPEQHTLTAANTTTVFSSVSAASTSSLTSGGSGDSPRHSTPPPITAADSALNTPVSDPGPASVTPTAPKSIDLPVPEEEYAFLVSLGWTGEEEEEGDGDALTEEEIAAFKAQMTQTASSRCSTPQLHLSGTAPTSRTTSPAPYPYTSHPTFSPGYAATTATRPLLKPMGRDGVDAGLVLSARGTSGHGNSACQVVVESAECEAPLLPLFPGVSPGWFGGAV